MCLVSLRLLNQSKTLSRHLPRSSARYGIGFGDSPRSTVTSLAFYSHPTSSRPAAPMRCAGLAISSPLPGRSVPWLEVRDLREPHALDRHGRRRIRWAEWVHAVQPRQECAALGHGDQIG